MHKAVAFSKVAFTLGVALKMPLLPIMNKNEYGNGFVAELTQVQARTSWVVKPTLLEIVFMLKRCFSVDPGT